MDKIVGIYKITNTINNKCYIGQSINIYKRFNKHKSSYKNPNCSEYNDSIYKAIREYGINSFTFEIVETCKKEELDDKEKCWIKYYDSFFNGYNDSLGGSSHLKMPKEKLINIIKDLEEDDLTLTEISNKWNVAVSLIHGINNGKYSNHDRIYPIRKVQKKEKIAYCKYCGKEIYFRSQKCAECTNKLRKICPEKEELEKSLKIKNFYEIAKIYNVSERAVRKWCEKYKLPYKVKELKEYQSKYLL